VDETHVSELLPGLYREVLDAVAVLEGAGRRREADRVRAQATIAYSKAWNQVAARRLRRLRDDARRIVAGRHGTRPTRAWRTVTGPSIEHRPA
jgi:hypothetical protein